MLFCICICICKYLSTNLELFASDRTASSLTYFCNCICVCYCICTFCICTCQQTKDISLLVRPLLYCSRQDRVGSDPQARRLGFFAPHFYIIRATMQPHHRWKRTFYWLQKHNVPKYYNTYIQWYKNTNINCKNTQILLYYSCHNATLSQLKNNFFLIITKTQKHTNTKVQDYKKTKIQFRHGTFSASQTLLFLPPNT